MGALPDTNRVPLQFGVFQLNPSTGELRKHGIRIRLQEQPLKLLLTLLQTPGEICTREELIRAIWAEGTFVDYERGLNVAVTRLRQALGDSAESPRYIETLGRKGYRFIAPVERLTSAEPPRLDSVVVAVAQQPAAPPGPPVLPPRPRFGPGLAVLAGAAALLALLFLAVKWQAPDAPPRPLIRLTLDLQDMPAAGLGTGSLVAVSRDGTRIAVSVNGPDGRVHLATRRLDQSRLTLLPGTENAASPFFSPDGRQIAFFADGKLQRIPTEGGVPIKICDADTHAAGRVSMYYPSGSWGDDGTIVAALNVGNGLSRISVTGGPPEPLKIRQEPGEIFRWPQILPGNDAVLFTGAQGDYENGTLDVFTFKTGERKTLQQGGILGKYVRPGHLVYVHLNELFAAPFDLKNLRLSGSPRPVLEDMGGRLAGWNFDVSDEGSFVYESQPRDARSSIFWLARDGKLSPLQTVPGFYSGPAFSPEGKRLAFSMSGRSSQGLWVQNIWVQNLELGTASPLTALSAVNDSPVWTADGQSLIFRSVSQPHPGIYTVPADGGGSARKIADLSAGVFPSSVSADGSNLALWGFPSGAVWIAPLHHDPDGPRLAKPELALQTMNLTRTSPAFSPDGRWLAYCSLESGQIEVYVRPFPGPGGKWQVSNAGGTHPVWSRNGRELFYMTRPGKKIMSVKYKVAGDTFLPSEPAPWSGRTLLDLGELNSYAAAPDGERLAVVLFTDGAATQGPATSLTVLLNFSDELRRLMPAR